jgi:hypothetical protein
MVERSRVDVRSMYRLGRSVRRLPGARSGRNEPSDHIGGLRVAVEIPAWVVVADLSPPGADHRSYDSAWESQGSRACGDTTEVIDILPPPQLSLTPHPTLIESFQTTCVKWPTPPPQLGLSKL